MEVDGNFVDSEPIYINPDIKRKTASSYALPVEGHIFVTLQTGSEILQIILTSSIENKMRLVILSSLLVVVNHSAHETKVFTFAADVGEKLEGFKRNEIPTKKFKVLQPGSSEADKQGTPIPSFTDLCGAKGKRKINTNFSSLIAFGRETDDASIPIKIQTTIKKCINVPSESGNIPISVSIIKHNEQFFVSIHDDPSPYMNVKNDTDFNLYVAQTDMVNPSTKYILPHKEVKDERFSWFQTVPSKKTIFYTPPTINEHFPEITNPDYGLIFACVTGDDFVRWSQPIKIDGTKKIIISVPMFGDVKLNVDTHEKTAQITIGYIQNEKEDPKNEPSREVYRAISHQTFLDVNSNYQKTFSVARKVSARAFNVNFYSKGISFTIYKDGDRKRAEQISLIVDEIGARYSKLECKLNLNFNKVQVDNELFESGDYDFPVVLCNKDMPKTLNHRVSGTSIWDLCEILDEQLNNEIYTVDIDLHQNSSIENVTVKLLPIRLYIEDTFINVLMETFEDCLPTNLTLQSNENRQRVKLENGMVLVPTAVVEQSLYFSEPLRLKSIRLEPLHILLSVHTCMR